MTDTAVKGDCFIVALQFAIETFDDRDRYRVCHGTVTGQQELEGVQFEHAWIEDTFPIPEAMPAERAAEFVAFGLNVNVIDRSNGNDVEMPRSMYYRLGRIDPASVTRYELRDAMRRAVRSGHYGPWEET